MGIKVVSNPQRKIKMSNEQRKERIEKLIEKLASEIDAAFKDDQRPKLFDGFQSGTGSLITEVVQKRLYRFF